MKKLLPLLLLAACSVELPPVEPERFACESDAPAEDGTQQCPDDRTCFEAHCRPRLDCNVSVERDGCKVDESACEAFDGPELAALRCSLGVITASVAIRPQPMSPRCPTLMYEVAFASGPPMSRYPLFVLPEGIALPIGSYGITGEVEDWRRCAQACSSEANCPGGHTCRPAAMVDVGGQTSSRHTIGVCYPNRLVATRTSTTIEEAPEPDSNACRQDQDCARSGRSGPCQAEVLPTEDHPTVPGAPAWANKYSFFSRCTNASSNLLEERIACDRNDSCRSGICLQRCARPCDPGRPGEGCDSRSCVRRTAEKTLPGGQVVRDQVFVCEF
jgi:hypothetical protein